MTAALARLLDASAMPPEIPLAHVAAGSFDELSWPILVAAACQEQYEDFVFTEGLICSETRRFVGSPESFRGNRRYDHPGKILLLLPGWEQSPSTELLVDWWVKNDRYTVQLDAPLSPEMRDQRRTIAWMAALCVAALVLFFWMASH